MTNLTEEETADNGIAVDNGISNALLALVKALPAATRAEVSTHLEKEVAEDNLAIETMTDALDREATAQKLALVRAMIEAAKCS